MTSHLSIFSCHSILSIHKILGGLATLFLLSVKWCLRRTFRLRSDPRQMSPLAVRPIERCRVSRNAVLRSIASAIVCNKQQGDILTSQTTTVLGAHLARTWKSWPKAIWSYRNFNRKSLSSCLYPIMWRVTVTLMSVDLKQGKTYDLHCGFTKMAFSPVACRQSQYVRRKSETKGPTGCVRTNGCIEATGSLRTMLPRLLLF